MGIAALALCAGTGQALSATTWTLGTGSVSAGGITETTTGWANTNGTGASVNGYTIEQQSLTMWSGSGLGIYNLDSCSTNGNVANCDASENLSPEHAVDNNERYEMLLLSFTSSVSLTGLQIGWQGADSDMSVLAWTKAGAPAALTGKSWNQLVGLGWEVIGNYSNVVASTSTVNSINGGGVSSSYWLVGAYNDLAAGTTNGLTKNDDYVKIFSVSGDAKPPTIRVPEPGSLALFGLAMMGMMSLRKRRSA
jgi:hypothetical protein